MVTLTRKQRAALIGVALDKPRFSLSYWASKKNIPDEIITDLNDLELIGIPNRGYWDITDKGLEVLESYDNSQTSTAAGEDADAS